MDLTTIGALAAVLVPIAALILHALGILEKLGALIARIWRSAFGAKAHSHIPRETLVVMERPVPNSLWWHMGSTGGTTKSPMMQVCADLNVTNTWNANITMAGAILRHKKWGLFSRTRLADAHVFNGGVVISPNSMAWVRVHVMFAPPWKKVGQQLVADVAIVDQFNNRHWLTGLKFPCH